MASTVRRFLCMNDVAASSAESHAVTLLSGPPSCGKTSLLFQFAYNRALPSNSDDVPAVGIDPSCGVFERIQMKYVEDDEAVKKYFAAFHLHGSFLAAVVIDNFGRLFDESNNGRCEILLADTHHGDSPRLLYIYKRWVSSIFIIKGDGCGLFLLSSSSKTGNGNSIRRQTAKYSTALQYLFLEAIDDDPDQ